MIIAIIFLLKSMRNLTETDINIHGERMPFSPITKVSGPQLLDSINCNGIQDNLSPNLGDDISSHSWKEVLNPQTQATQWIYEQEFIGRDGIRLVRNLERKDPIISWFGVLPFALCLNPDIEPNLHIRSDYQELFNRILLSAKQELILPDGKVSTYPLSPDRNL